MTIQWLVLLVPSRKVQLSDEVFEQSDELGQISRSQIVTLPPP